MDSPHPAEAVDQDVIGGVVWRHSLLDHLLERRQPSPDVAAHAERLHQPVVRYDVQRAAAERHLVHQA